MGRFFLYAFIIVLSILCLLFLTIYLETDGHYDMNGRKLIFSVRAYKAFKLIGGYIATYPGGLALHVSPKKAILIPYSDMDKERKRFSIVRTFRLKVLNLTVETGAEYLMPTALAQTFFRIVFMVLGGKKEKIENNLWLVEKDILRVSLNFIVRLNVFMLLCNFIKYLKEKVKLLCQTKMRKSTI